MISVPVQRVAEMRRLKLTDAPLPTKVQCLESARRFADNQQLSEQQACRLAFLAWYVWTGLYSHIPRRNSIVPTEQIDALVTLP